MVTGKKEETKDKARKTLSNTCVFEKKVVSLQRKEKDNNMKKQMLKHIRTQIVCLLLLAVCGMCVVSCNYLDKKRSQGVIAECCGKTLTIGDIEQLTQGFTGADSARIAEEYIRNWAVELLMYSSSHRVTSHQIEELVEDYRRSLYVSEYEQLLIAQRMPLAIEDTLVDAFYKEHKQQLVLREMILKGALIVLPNGAPDLANLRRQMNHLPSAESLEWIEKYVYQYGVGYELFVEDWKLSNEVLSYLPIEQTELDKLLRKEQLIEIQDSVNTYFLEVLDYYSAGSVMPLDYARKDIEKNILGARSREFVKTARQELYEKSVKNGKLKRYEK